MFDPFLEPDWINGPEDDPDWFDCPHCEDGCNACDNYGGAFIDDEYFRKYMIHNPEATHSEMLEAYFNGKDDD